jgi:antitoxin (DNA-binding transcriptional repressor) of toxin-antitoxin stability system
MQVRNVHERVFPAPPAQVGALIDTLASADDRLWPGDRWPPMRFDRALSVGARGDARDRNRVRARGGGWARAPGGRSSPGQIASVQVFYLIIEPRTVRIGHALLAHVTEVARNFADYVNRVACRGERFVIMRGRRPVAELRPLPAAMRLGELPALLETLPRLGAEDAAAFEDDLTIAREQLGRRPERDAWES